MTLTREEILAKEPGEELDMLVATHVFGCEPAFNSLPEYPRVKSKCGRFSEPIEDYSTEISAAWEVEEQIKKLRLHAAYVSALKQVLVRTGEYVGMFDYIHATSEQRCKAALLAVLNL